MRRREVIVGFGDGAAGDARNLSLKRHGNANRCAGDRKAAFGCAGNMDMKLDRTFALVMCGFGLAACSSFTMPGFDALKAKPTTTVLLIQSNPAGAEARSSLGPTCRTPCTMAIGAAGDFTVSLARDGYEPQTVTVHSTMSEGGYVTGPSPTLDPTSVDVTLEPLPQAKTPARQRPRPSAAQSRVQP
jgi:hypothetical protein